MREAIGSTYLFQIVVVLILFFAAFISMSINYSRAFSVSAEIADIIERYNGLSEDAEAEITEYLHKISFYVSGECNKDASGWISHSTRAANEYKDTGEYCTYAHVTNEANTSEYPTTAYYDIKVFYKLDIPILKSFLTFKVVTSTKQIYYPYGV